MSFRKHCLLFVRWIVFLAWCPTWFAVAAAPPAGLEGTWDVVQVAVDGKDQPHWLFKPNDPRLLGRELAITDSAASLNDDSRACSKPIWEAHTKVVLHTLIARSFKRPPHPDLSLYPTLSDFGLNLPDAMVTPLRVRCTPENTDWSEAWFLPLAPDRLLTNYAAGVVLVLKRRMPESESKPSFSCAKAQVTAELTICKSVPLAAYDRSVTAAYRWARDNSGDENAELKQEQTDWIKQRNACAADVECLAKTMRERVDALMQN